MRLQMKFRHAIGKLKHFHQALICMSVLVSTDLINLVCPLLLLKTFLFLGIANIVLSSSATTPFFFIFFLLVALPI